MKKKFIIDNEEKEMSFNEIYQQFQPGIYHMIHQFKLTNDFLEEEDSDLAQDLSMVLYKCYEDYDIKHKGHFSTYFFESAKNRLKSILNHSFRAKRRGRLLETSLYHPIKRDNGGDSILIGDTISASANVESSVELSLLIEKINNMSKNEMHQDILLFWSGGCTVQEIADKHNITRQAVYKAANQHKRRLKNVIGGDIYDYFTHR